MMGRSMRMAELRRFLQLPVCMAHSSRAAVPEQGHSKHRKVWCSADALSGSSRAPLLSPSLAGPDASRARTDLQAAATAYREVHVHANDISGRQRLQSTNAPRRRLRVAVDVDEVLGRFVHTLNQYCKETHNEEYEVSDYFVYEFAKIWNCSQDKSNEIVHSFFKSRHFCEGIPTIPGALESLQRLGKYCDLVVVTSRQHCIQTMTEEWLEQHYPGIFTEVYFGNHFALEGKSRKKSEICRSIRADVLIDDNPNYALDCANEGIAVLLYDWQHSYPWSKMPAGVQHPLISVVQDWDACERALELLHQTTCA